MFFYPGAFFCSVLSAVLNVVPKSAPLILISTLCGRSIIIPIIKVRKRRPREINWPTSGCVCEITILPTGVASHALCSCSSSLILFGGQPLASDQTSLTPHWVPYGKHVWQTRTLHHCGFSSVTHAYKPLMVLVYLLCHFLSLTNFFFPSLALIWHHAAWVFNQCIPHPHSHIQQALTSGKCPGLDARPPAETGPTASP